MSDPQCPAHYVCSFTPQTKYVVHVQTGPWWQHSAGWVVAVIAVLLLAAVIAYMAYLWSDARRDQRDREDQQRERDHELALEEQRTMQAEEAKGNPEMLKLIRQTR